MITTVGPANIIFSCRNNKKESKKKKGKYFLFAMRTPRIYSLVCESCRTVSYSHHIVLITGSL